MIFLLLRQYTNDLTTGLRAMKVNPVENYDFGHYGTSSYATDSYDILFRNMHNNLTFMHKVMNRDEFANLEGYGLS